MRRASNPPILKNKHKTKSNQPNNQAIYQPKTNQTMKQCLKKLCQQSTNQAIKQSMAKTANQTIDQSNKLANNE